MGRPVAGVDRGVAGGVRRPGGDGHLTAAGPFTFQRAADEPQPEIRGFSVDNPRAAYLLEWKNGAADGSSPPVTSAVAYLNGEREKKGKGWNKPRGTEGRAPIKPWVRATPFG